MCWRSWWPSHGSSCDFSRDRAAQEQLTDDVAQRLFVEEKDETGQEDQDDRRENCIEAGMKTGEYIMGDRADESLKKVYRVTGSAEQEHGPAGEKIGEPAAAICETVDGPAKAADGAKRDECISDASGYEGTASQNARGGNPVVGRGAGVEISLAQEERTKHHAQKKLRQRQHGKNDMNREPCAVR